MRFMADRYNDIKDSFPDDLQGQALESFMYWVINNIVIVKIEAYSEENAYTIFETMNDRGLNLTNSDMLKGFILSKFHDEDEVGKDKSDRSQTFYWLIYKVKKSMELFSHVRAIVYLLLREP